MAGTRFSVWVEDRSYAFELTPELNLQRQLRSAAAELGLQARAFSDISPWFGWAALKILVAMPQVINQADLAFVSLDQPQNPPITSNGIAELQRLAEVPDSSARQLGIRVGDKSTVLCPSRSLV